jgi:uncharacterized membrane protein
LLAIKGRITIPIIIRGSTLSDINFKSFLQFIKDWINRNPGTAIGIAIGLILGILLFTMGIFRTLLLLLFMAFGYWLGRNKNKNTSILEMISKFFKHDD